MSDLLERLVGEGRVLKGDEFIATAQYEVRVYQTYVETRTLDKGRARIPSLSRAECRIIHPSPPIPVSRDRLTLIMNDGRKIDFFMAGHSTAMPTGGIYQ